MRLHPRFASTRIRTGSEPPPLSPHHPPGPYVRDHRYQHQLRAPCFSSSRSRSRPCSCSRWRLRWHLRCWCVRVWPRSPRQPRAVRCPVARASCVGRPVFCPSAPRAVSVRVHASVTGALAPVPDARGSFRGQLQLAIFPPYALLATACASELARTQALGHMYSARRSAAPVTPFSHKPTQSPICVMGHGTTRDAPLLQLAASPALVSAPHPRLPVTSPRTDRGLRRRPPRLEKQSFVQVRAQSLLGEEAARLEA